MEFPKNRRISGVSLASFFMKHFTLSDRLLSFYARQWYLRIPPRLFFQRSKFKLLKMVMPYTMGSCQRLENVYQLASAVEETGQQGAFVECGVWKGGCAGVMAAVAQTARSNRKIWLFDSFEGLPEPTAEDGQMAKLYAGRDDATGRLSTINRCVGLLEDVRELLFGKLKIDERNVVIRKGWFQESLPQAATEIGPITILRIDADWYESVETCFKCLYEHVIPGGYIILDDYFFWEGCRKATDEFIAARNLDVELCRVDATAAYFKKPLADGRPRMTNPVTP
jgi:hypothetical protein